MLLCNSGHGFFILRQKKTEFGSLGYQECFCSASSTRSVGFPTPARFTVIFWSLPLPLKEWYLDFLRSKVWIWEKYARFTSRASGVLQEIIHLISWGSSDFPWLDFRSKFHPNPMFCSKQVLVIPCHSPNHGVDFVPNDFGMQNTVSP